MRLRRITLASVGLKAHSAGILLEYFGNCRDGTDSAVNSWTFNDPDEEVDRYFNYDFELSSISSSTSCLTFLVNSTVYRTQRCVIQPSGHNELPFSGLSYVAHDHCCSHFLQRMKPVLGASCKGTASSIAIDPSSSHHPFIEVQPRIPICYTKLGIDLERWSGGEAVVTAPEADCFLQIG